MAATLEATMIETVIDQATPEQKKYLVQRLLPQVLESTRYMPQPITNSVGETVGFFVPRYRSTKTTPPEFSPEQQVELDRRLATLDDSVELDEFIKLLDLEDAQQSK